MDSKQRSDIRLGDRILSALELALDQGDLKISELLASALDLTLTRNITPEGYVERRDYPPELEKAMIHLDELRRIGEMGGEED
jgi:hypothetical protein